MREISSANYGQSYLGPPSRYPALEDLKALNREVKYDFARDPHLPLDRLAPPEFPSYKRDPSNKALNYQYPVMASEKPSARVRFEEYQPQPEIKSPVVPRREEQAQLNPLLSEESTNKYILTSDERKPEPPKYSVPERRDVIQPYRREEAYKREEPPKYDRYNAPTDQMRPEPCTAQLPARAEPSKYQPNERASSYVGSADAYRREAPLGLNTVKNSPSQNRRLDDGQRYDKYSHHHAPSVSYHGGNEGKLMNDYHQASFAPMDFEREPMPRYQQSTTIEPPSSQKENVRTNSRP